MPRKRYNAEEIIHKLREADVHLSQGRSVKQVNASDSMMFSLTNGFWTKCCIDQLKRQQKADIRDAGKDYSQMGCWDARSPLHVNRL